MKAKLVKESIHDFLKPKSEEELGEAYHEMKCKTDEFMTKIFSDLHKDPKHQNIYINNNGEWMFEHDLENESIYVSYHRIWQYFRFNITSNYDIVKMLIESWLSENTDWPKWPAYDL